MGGWLETRPCRGHPSLSSPRQTKGGLVEFERRHLMKSASVRKPVAIHITVVALPLAVIPQVREMHIQELT